MAECGKRVEGNVVSYQCQVQLPEGQAVHPGPCMAVENARSVRMREKWETEQRNLASGLGQFQGPALTTAQRNTENPTEHPSVTAARIADAQEARAQAAAVAPGNPAVYRDAGQATSLPVDGWIDVGAGMVCTACGGAGEVKTEGAFTRFGPTIVCPRCHGSKREPVTVGDVAVQPPMETMPDPVPAVPTKQREGDQPLPEQNDRPFIQDAVIADIEARKAVGVERYGTPLQPFNGRNTLLDWYEEMLDAAIYGKQLQVEAEEMLGRALRVAGFCTAYAQNLAEADAVAADARSVVLWLQQMVRRPEPTT